MKKFKFFVLGTAVLLVSGVTFANGSVYYVQFDYCNDYYANCTKRVIKCRDFGTRFCETAIQLPCEEACNPVLAP